MTEDRAGHNSEREAGAEPRGRRKQNQNCRDQFGNAGTKATPRFESNFAKDINRFSRAREFEKECLQENHRSRDAANPGDDYRCFAGVIHKEFSFPVLSKEKPIPYSDSTRKLNCCADLAARPLGRGAVTANGNHTIVRSAVAQRLTIHMKRILFLALALPLLLSQPAKAQLPVKKVLTLEVVKKIAAAAEAESKKRGATVVIVVVDDGGHLLLLERLDDTQVASVEVGIGKARTAAIFRRPSKVFEDQVRDGRVAALALPGATPLQGGIPIEFEGKVIGAIGVSGNTPQEDEDIAKVGAASAVAAIGQLRVK